MEVYQLWKKTLFLWFPVENVAKPRIWFSPVSLSLLWPKDIIRVSWIYWWKVVPTPMKWWVPSYPKKVYVFPIYVCCHTAKILEILILLLLQIIFWLPVCTLLAWSCWCADVHCGHCAAAWLDMLLIRRTGTSNWKSWNLFQQQQSQHSSLSIAAYLKAA